jgi:hypothetical protein
MGFIVHEPLSATPSGSAPAPPSYAPPSRPIRPAQRAVAPPAAAAAHDRRYRPFG